LRWSEGVFAWWGCSWCWVWVWRALPCVDVFAGQRRMVGWVFGVAPWGRLSVSVVGWCLRWSEGVFAWWGCSWCSVRESHVARVSMIPR
jgi:hypothetical protein